MTHVREGATSSAVEAPARRKVTPFMRQYEQAKAEHPDAILFFRMGDFYEMFREDAVLAARLLNLTLTSRDKDHPEPIPMAGVPHHAAAGYAARLLALGHKVALCEQMADPAKCKGIVPRQVVRVLTPGLVTDGDLLEARANHYLAAVEKGDDGPEAAGLAPGYGLALLDLSTAELTATRLHDAAALFAELARADPREVLLGPGLGDLRGTVSLAAPRATLRDDPEVEPSEVDRVLEETLRSGTRVSRPPRPRPRCAARRRSRPPFCEELYEGRPAPRAPDRTP